jgi:hypothetical protein
VTVLYADFTAAFPEFANATTFPATGVNFWLTQADTTLDACRFGTNLPLAAMLFAAHNLALGAREATGAVGATFAPVSSKSVASVSIGYDTGIGSIAGAGIYNTTSYGQRFYKLLQGVAAGGLYVAAPQAMCYPFGSPGRRF